MSDAFDHFIDSNGTMRQIFPGYKRFIVTWHVDAVKFGRKKMSIGLCEKTGGVAFAASDYLHPLIVQDVVVDDKHGCGDAGWCLDIDCDLNRNKVDPKFIRQYGIRNRRELENVHRRLEEWITKAELKICKQNTQLIYKEPVVTIKKAPKHDE